MNSSKSEAEVPGIAGAIAEIEKRNLPSHLRGTEYGCVKCQRYHVADNEPALFMAHLYHQSKHGTRRAQ